MIIIVIAFTALTISLNQLVGENLFTQRIRDDQRIAETLSERLGVPLVSLDIENLTRLSVDVAEENTARVLVLDTYGVVQFDTCSELSGIRLANREVANVLNGASQDYGFYDAGDGNAGDGSGNFWMRSALSFYENVRAMNGLYAESIEQGQQQVGVLVYISPVQEIYEDLRRIQLQIILWMIVVLVLVLIISVWIMHTMTKPIADLSEGIKRMSSGELSVRVNAKGKNEFAELGRAFNSMSERIEALDTARSQFVSSASHELKTPLATMKILLESLMYNDHFDVDKTKEFLQDTNREIDRLNNVVSDLLTLVKMDSEGTKLNLENLRLRALVEEQMKRLLPLARENGIEMDLEAREEIIISGDSLKLQQVIYNVIDNAIKYTPRGGEVHVSLTRGSRKAVIRIADTGCGIPAKDLPHIFERFYRVDKARSRATGGTGLGLSIVKQIVTQHGGSIDATSTEGKGTTFTIELPIQQPETT